MGEGSWTAFVCVKCRPLSQALSKPGQANLPRPGSLPNQLPQNVLDSNSISPRMRKSESSLRSLITTNHLRLETRMESSHDSGLSTSKYRDTSLTRL